MYLHRLRLRAIGPYAGEYEIDFAALGASGVFLLEGPTGSGKSTIIDAIVFALYGGLAGSASSDDRLTSHHAAATVEPFVELDFETTGGLFRIRRTPARLRPKVNGQGTTKVNQSVSLVRLGSLDAFVGEPISTRAPEVGAHIVATIGLTRDQFLQTVVLPQGEFARFLGATGEERKKVLESLFGTGLYERTTEILIARRREAQAAVSSSEAAVLSALAALRGAAGDDTLELADATNCSARFAEVAAAAITARDAAKQEHATALAELDRVVKRKAAIDRKTVLLARRSELVAASVTIDAKRLQLDRGRRASTVESALGSIRTARQAHSEARDRVEGVQARHLELAQLDESTLRSRQESLADELVRLRAAAELEATLDTRREHLREAEEALRQAKALQADDTASLSDRREERPRLEEAVANALTGQSDLELAAREVAVATEQLSELGERDRLRASVQAALQQLKAAADDARRALDLENALRRRRIDGMAGELADELIAGEPCSVCGAREHPNPAALVAEHPGQADIDEAAALRAAAEKTLNDLREEHAGFTAVLAELDERLSELTVSDGQSKLAAADERVRQAETAAAALTSARAALHAFDRDTEAIEQRLHEQQLAAAAEHSRLDGERKAIEADVERVRAALDGRAAACSPLIASLDQQRAAAAELLAARDTCVRSALDEATREHELREALDRVEFESADDAAAALQSPGVLEALEAEIAQHRNDVAIVDKGLGDPELREVTGTETVDLDGAQAAAETAGTRYEQSADEATRALDRSERCAKAVTAVGHAIAAGERVAANARAVVRMAEVTSASGPANLHGVTLGTYVLLRRFDDVVAAANSRLGVMSSGRYRLEASETRESGSRSRRTGLALAIRDNATDTTRDPKSFSGGETFYASLSLALGLADVVQAEAGGIDLGTLFVDEGFGSLDPETLDSVMTELGTLSANGRVVGIVSHVEDLKLRIADRIEVRRRADGSSSLRATSSALAE